MKVWNWIRRGGNLLLVLTVASVVLGICVGLAVRPAAPSEEVVRVIGFPGEIFMALLKLLTVPLIVSSLISGEFKPEISPLQYMYFSSLIIGGHGVEAYEA